MTSRAKVPIILLIGLILLSLAFAASSFYLFHKERLKNIAMQAQLEELEARQRDTETKLERSNKMVSGLQLKLQEAQMQIDSLGKALQEEKASRQEALVKMEQLRLDLEEQKESRLDLENKFSRAQNDVRKTQEQIKALESEKGELVVKIKDLEERSQKVELGKIVVSPEPATPLSAEKKAKVLPKKKEKIVSSSFLEGKVLVVNKEYNFAVINLGSKDGVRLGDTLSLFHDNKRIGAVKVEKLHDAMSAVGFLSDDIKDKISEGDQVVQEVK